MTYRHLFFDLDHTLWDFDTNARLTLQDLYETLALRERGVSEFEKFHQNYLLHNQQLWAKYRNGRISQATLRVRRMELALLDFKIADKALSEKMSIQFLEKLPSRNTLFPYTIEILDYLTKKNYRLHLITNGFEEVQHHKIRHAGLEKYFREVITSEGSNSLKPEKAIFDFALRAAGATAAESIMLGDDLETDIIGAYRAGLDQVYVNHTGKEPEFQPTYIIRNLKELEEIF